MHHYAKHERKQERVCGAEKQCKKICCKKHGRARLGAARPHVSYPYKKRSGKAADHPRGKIISQGPAPGHMGRSILGNDCHTLIPQKWEPSVQIGEATPART